MIEQVNLCLVRGFQRLKGDASLTTTAIFGNFIISLILGSVFYDMPSDTSSFYSRGVLLFYAVLMSAFSSALEVSQVLGRIRQLTNKVLDIDTLRSTSHCGKTSTIRILSSICGGHFIHALRSSV